MSAELRDHALVERVLSARSVWEALGVSPGSTSLAEARRVHRRTSLLVHPDKCADPRATQAFQRLGSFAVELERLAGDAAGQQSSDWSARRRRDEEEDIEWEEGSSCGSWGGESTSEDDSETDMELPRGGAAQPPQPDARVPQPQPGTHVPHFAAQTPLHSLAAAQQTQTDRQREIEQLYVSARSALKQVRTICRCAPCTYS